MAKALAAPFPYFGGKSAIAHRVWDALGDVKHYIEPFFGSGAVLLARPGYRPGRHTETVNDKDGYVANVWRALQADPDEVARWCDWPVNHADLSARRGRLVRDGVSLLERLAQNEDYYDAKLAGYWVWAASCWIGRGLTRQGSVPHLGDGGKGVHKIGKRPHLSDSGTGVHRIGKRPHRGSAFSNGVGVHKLTGVQEGTDPREPYSAELYRWFRDLSERLRYVRVVCGDWTRVTGGDWQDNKGTCGMYFDPPYGIEDRDADLYHEESLTVALDVARWAAERGDRPSYRIVLSGYDEHDWLLERGWTAENWSAQGGYGHLGDGQAAANRHRERLYFSPHCVGARQVKML